MKKYLYSLLFIFLLLPFYAKAAVLSLNTPKEEYSMGDSFTVNIALDINDVCVNTVETKIEFPPNILFVEGFVTGDSLLSVWVSEPSEKDIFDANDSGEFYIAGGIPGGYCGKIPGDPGDSNLIGRILFRIPSFYVGDTIPDTLNISLVDSKVYVNDGLGTIDKLTKNNLSIKLNKKGGNEVGDYNTFIKNDKTKPEPFVIELHKSENIYQGQYYVIFSTLDKQSGIDHYEILEANSLSAEKTLTEKLIDLIKKPQVAEWKIAQTPQLLEDQSLRSIIKVRAVDKAGNQREVEYIPPEPNIAKAINFDYLIIAIAVLLLLVLIYFLYKFLRFVFIKVKKKKDDFEGSKEDQSSISSENIDE